jgi:hypothetical protein
MVWFTRKEQYFFAAVEHRKPALNLPSPAGSTFTIAASSFRVNAWHPWMTTFMVVPHLS